MKRGFIIGLLAFVLLSFLFVFEQARFSDGKLRVVFCDVGQGDAIFIRTPNGSDILIDGGPDDKVLSCLAKHMPFWDRDLELVILTHPHADHLNGLISVAKRFKISSFATEELRNTTSSFLELMRLLEDLGIKTRYLHAKDRFSFSDNVRFTVVGPTREFIKTTSPMGIIGESGEFASLIIHVEYENFSVLLTGDSQTSGLKEALMNGVANIDVLQVPHHGSRTGLNSQILEVLRPKLAVISVGKNNRYGHPVAFILKLLEDNRIKLLRTDTDGEIEIVSDGKNWTPLLLHQGL